QVQRRFDLVQVFMPRGGQRNAAAAAIEQGLAQGGFQLADALADRAGGDAEFFGGPAERPQPGGGLERLDRGQRGESEVLVSESEHTASWRRAGHRPPRAILSRNARSAHRGARQRRISPAAAVWLVAVSIRM